MHHRNLALALALLPLMVGCKHLRLSSRHSCNKPGAYASAQSVPSIRVPPGIDKPDTHAALRIPELNEPAPPPRKPKDSCLDEPPSFTVPKATRTAPGAG